MMCEVEKSRGLGEECIRMRVCIIFQRACKMMTVSVIWGFFPIALFSAFSRWRQVSIIWQKVTRVTGCRRINNKKDFNNNNNILFDGLATLLDRRTWSPWAFLLPPFTFTPALFIIIFFTEYSGMKGVWKEWKIWKIDGQTADGKGVAASMSLCAYVWRYLQRSMKIRMYGHMYGVHMYLSENETGMHNYLAPWVLYYSSLDDRPNVKYVHTYVVSELAWDWGHPNPCLYAWRAGRSKKMLELFLLLSV